MRKLAENRWFPLVSLILTMMAGALWQILGGRMGWRPMALAAAPVVVRVGANKRPFIRTPFDGWIWVLMGTAVLGVFTAYSGDLALQKFQIILAGVLIFYAQAAVSRKDIWRVTVLWGTVGAGVAAYALATQNWNAFPAEIGVLNRFGNWWMGVRPYLNVKFIHPNAAGGLIAMLFPMQIVYWRRVWRRRNTEQLLITGGLMAFTLFGLLMTSSRGAWAALAVGLGCWYVWQVSGRWEKRLGQWRLVQPRRIFAATLILLIAAGIGGMWALSLVTGFGEASTRWALMSQTVNLTQDFAVTGSGLGTFPALYAQYIEVVPVFVVQYSNFYLDLLLELGWTGLAAMTAILAGSFVLLTLPPSSRNADKKRNDFTEKSIELRELTQILVESKSVQSAKSAVFSVASRNAYKKRGQTAVDLRWAVFAGLVTLALQGLFDDHLFGGMGTPFLLVWPGLAVYVSGKRRRKARPFRPFWQGRWQQMQYRWRRQSRQRQTALVTGVVVVVALGGAAAARPFLSQWQANLGALAMARVELPGWPTGEWDDGSSTNELLAAKGYFERALTWSPNNRTALHRLGLIAMLNREYETAVAYLEAAHQQDEAHRGVTKSLAYSYVWAGKPKQAAPLFAAIPEAGREMFIYTDWWQVNGRPDLAARAEAALALIQNQANGG